MENLHLSIFILCAKRRLGESNSVWLAYIQSTVFSDEKRLMKKEITSEKMTENSNINIPPQPQVDTHFLFFNVFYRNVL